MPSSPPTSHTVSITRSRATSVAALGLTTVLALTGIIGCSRDERAPATTTTPTGGTGTTAPDTTISGPIGTTAGPDTTVKALGIASTTSPYGEILVDSEGRTLYVFLNDTGGTSTCTGTCATAWPAFTVDRLLVPDGFSAEDFRRDPATGQVIFKNRPLYYFSGDSKPGDSNGQGIGDVWFVVLTDGNPANAKA